MSVSARFDGTPNLAADVIAFGRTHLFDINVVTKRAAMSIPVFGWGLWHAPKTPIDRGAPRRNLRRMRRLGRSSVREGRSLPVFPEGGRVPVAERRRFTRGFKLLCKGCNADVVPFVPDAGLHWPAGFAIERPALITSRLLPAIPPGRDRRAFAREIETVLNAEKESPIRKGPPQLPMAKAG
ncbi:MAG: lysophospholipid acyltransferase family protein [Pseudomonadota bacterium]